MQVPNMLKVLAEEETDFYRVNEDFISFETDTREKELMQLLLQGAPPRLPRPTKARRYTRGQGGTIYVHKAIGYGAWSSEEAKRVPKAVRAMLDENPLLEVELESKVAQSVPYWRRMHV